MAILTNSYDDDDEEQEFYIGPVLPIMPWDQINVCMAQVVNTESFTYTFDKRSDYDNYYNNLVAKAFDQFRKLPYWLNSVAMLLLVVIMRL